MTTVEGTRVKCPECGATVRAAGDVTKCEYCGTESRVQRRTQVFQIPIRLVPQADVPARVALQVRTRRWPVVLIMLVAIGVPIVAPLMLYFASQRNAAANDAMGWQSDAPVIADIDGDGSDDVIGVARYVQTDQMKLTAVSGKDGHVLWQTPSLGDYESIYRSKLALAGGLVIRADADNRAHVEAFDAKTGAKTWEQTPSEVVDKLCRTPAGITIVTKDKRGWTFAPATGALSPAVAPEPCDEAMANLIFQFEDPYRDVTIDGMSHSHTLGAKPPFIATGTKRPGSSVPMLAAFDADHHVVWKTEVPGANPLGAKLSDPEYVAIDDRDVAVVYERGSSRELPFVVAFDRATGQRRFEVPIRHQSGDTSVWLHGIALAKHAVLVIVDNSLQAFDRTTGKLLWYAGSLR